MWQEVNRRISQALRHIRQAFRGVTSATDSSTKVQQLQMKALAGENLDGAEYFQHYGFTSCPLPGTMAIIVPLNGSTSHSVVVATEHGAYRLTALKPGEVALYTDEGAKIVLKRGRIIDVECDKYRVKCNEYDVNAKNRATFTTPEVTASDQVIAEGKLTGNGGMAIKGGDGGATATFEGTLEQTGGDYKTDGDVIAGSISQKDHTHTNGNNGAPTGKPIA
ncbi:phage baseplate assembly protein V [Citrobacter braakii]|nr:phage baseplate assembly protein V [Citrobacter braakii]